MRVAIRLAIVAAAIVVLSAPVYPQQLGPAIWSAGYTRTLYVDCQNHAVRHVAIFNPNAVPDAARYGDAVAPNGISCGNTVGERANCEVIFAYVRGGFLPALTAANYTVCTSMDLNDAKLVTRSGSRALFDDMEAVVGATPTTTPPVNPAPACPPPVVCPSPIVCPSCPAPPACIGATLDSCQPFIAPVSTSLASCQRDSRLVTTPQEILDTLTRAKQAVSVSADLRARLVRLKAWVELTDRLQPLPGDVSSTLRWVATASAFGAGRRDAIKRLEEYVVLRSVR